MLAWQNKTSLLKQPKQVNHVIKNNNYLLINHDQFLTKYFNTLTDQPLSKHYRVRLQSWTKVLTHLSKTNAFYPRPYVNSKNVFFYLWLNPLSPFSMLKDASLTLPRGYNIEKGRGGRKVKIWDWKTHAFNETGLFRGVSQLFLSMIVWITFYTVWSFQSIITVPSTQ